LVLLAEDNPADAGLVRRALELHGVEGELLLLPDGEMAVEFMRALDADPAMELPSLAIIDLNLPKKVGREVLEFMIRSERCRQVPVIVLSSSDAARDRADVVRLGIARYFRKPTRLEEFLALGASFKAAMAPASE
jgi:DNA-binding response OmpR family regulator